MDTFGSCCGSCVHLNINDYSGSKWNCYCAERGGYHKLTESKCYKYDYDDNRDYYDLNHRWHIVSKICKILGLKDDYSCIDELLSFRNKKLENKEEYESFLKEYDEIGVLIANELEKDDDSLDMCISLCRQFLTPMLYLIRDEKYEDALGKYQEMYNFLKTCYGYDKKNSK